MASSLLLCCIVSLAGGPTVDSICLQAAPVPIDGKWARTDKQTKAVVLIHGFYYHFTDKNVAKPSLRPWQNADSPLVKELAKNADVFVFAYGQNAALDTIVSQSKLRENIAQLHKLGYSDIVLVGHSAGGLIARHFVEDHPESGVTRVVQVCAPNGGSPLAGTAVPRSQQAFVDCLTEKSREQCLKDRARKLIPKKVQFVCVVARSESDATTDGVVPCASQWSTDLHKQGIPAIGVIGSHRDVVRDAKLAGTLAKVIQGDHERWNADRVEKAKKEILGK